ncbi:MAG: sugar ABC transporter permease [Thermotoga sp.]|nr:MAG: sugar ABC transporter permease [Thermotoga sp.]
MRTKKYVPYLFLLPAIIGLFGFRLIPIIWAFLMSFTRWSVYAPPQWLGFANYKELFGSDLFREVLKNTFIYTIIYVPGVMIIGLILAVLVNNRLKGIAFFRGLLFAPVVTSAVAIGMVWGWILSPRFGILNHVLEHWFSIVNPPAWLGDRNIALIAIAFVAVWQRVGYQMILFLAGLQDIPTIFYEAARIDGASRWQRFWKITLPLLSPTTFFVLIISIIDSFRNFTIIYTMTRGGPGSSTTTLAYAIYQNAFIFSRMGYASSLAYILLIIVGTITLINFYFKKRWVKYKY